MAVRLGRGGPPDPVRDHLAEVRRALMRLHKSLIDSERAAYEQDEGPVSNTQLLSALLEDPFFQWMRPFSQLMAAMDEALFGDEPVTLEGARGFVRQAYALVGVPERATDDSKHYEQVRNQDPGVLFAHTELHRRIAAALLAYGDAAA
jgi:hypothetical protein